jgi:predicted GIY-YIG superfamily endonuclease
MFYTYVLQSQKDGKLYTGFSKDMLTHLTKVSLIDAKCEGFGP